MSKFKTALVLSTGLMLGSGHQAQANLTQKMLSPVIEYQCKQELKQSKTWKVATFLMSDASKEKMQSNVCQCVGKHAVDDVKATDVLKASISEDAKNQLVRQAVLNSVKGCVSEVISTP